MQRCYRICRSVKIAIMEEGITTGYRRLAGIAEGGVRIAISVSKNISSVGNAGSVGILAARCGKYVPLSDQPRPVNTFAARVLRRKES